uniref:Uncharacterized protein n=1 Tax=Physcomitrium patens TaxID=3218 RepID=A0A2K1ID79_PHYPA|nr:hypothetical protein PHYPA_029385 [Physcomitrium patens]
MADQVHDFETLLYRLTLLHPQTLLAIEKLDCNTIVGNEKPAVAHENMPMRPNSLFLFVRKQMFENSFEYLVVRGFPEPGSKMVAMYMGLACVFKKTRSESSGCGIRFKKYPFCASSSFVRHIPAGGLWTMSCGTFKGVPLKLKLAVMLDGGAAPTENVLSLL